MRCWSELQATLVGGSSQGGIDVASRGGNGSICVQAGPREVCMVVVLSATEQFATTVTLRESDLVHVGVTRVVSISVY